MNSFGDSPTSELLGLITDRSLANCQAAKPSWIHQALSRANKFSFLVDSGSGFDSCVYQPLTGRNWRRKRGRNRSQSVAIFNQSNFDEARCDFQLATEDIGRLELTVPFISRQPHAFVRFVESLVVVDCWTTHHT